VPEPTPCRDGNLRFAGIMSPGWPADPEELVAEVKRLLAGQSGIEPYGPAALLFSVPPSDLPPQRWECQVGTAITGLARSMGAMAVEDYRQLQGWALAHAGPVRTLGETWARLDAHVRSRGGRLRPYWRLALRRRRLADGNLLPVAEVAVFVDAP
jgi:hypothetical protein